MNIERLYDCSAPRHRVWCMSSELTAGATAGTYTLKDADLTASLGHGSELIVMDEPGRLLFWDAGNRVAYDWTSSGTENVSGGKGEVPV